MENGKKFGIVASVTAAAILLIVVVVEVFYLTASSEPDLTSSVSSSSATTSETSSATTSEPAPTPTQLPRFYLNSENNPLYESAPSFGATSGTSSITSEVGSTVAVEYTDFVQRRTTGNWHLIKSSGHFGNTEAITPLSSISFILNTNNATINVSWSADGANFSEETIDATTRGTTYTCDFDGDFPNYFVFENAGSSNVTVTSIEIDFACRVSVETEYIGSDSEETTHYGSASGAGQYLYQDEHTVVATPYEGFAFLGWYENDVKVSGDAEYTFSVPARDVDLVARFARKYWVILEKVDPNGPGTMIGTGQYVHGQSVTIGFAEEAYDVTVYDSDGNFLYSGYRYTFSMPEESIILYVEPKSL